MTKTAPALGARYFIGRCPVRGCKHTERRELVVNTSPFGRCPDHGTYTLAQGMGFYVEAVKCGARCRNAVGPACDCSCGGHNHGIGHAA